MLESPRHGQAREQDHPHQRHDTWRAGCGESRTSGSEGGPGKPTSREAGRAPRSDPYTKLQGPEAWRYYDLYVVIDIFSRYVVAWCVAPAESASSPKSSSQTPWPATGSHRSADDSRRPGSSMTSNPVRELLTFLGIGPKPQPAARK